MSIAATWYSPMEFGEATIIKRSIPEELAATLTTAGDREVVFDGDRRLTTREIAAVAARVQRWLRNCGVGRGDCVAVQLPNWWETVAICHAVWGLGAVLCPIPPTYRVAELSKVFAALPVQAIVVPGSYRSLGHSLMIEEILGEAGPPVLVLNRWEPVASDSAVDDSATVTLSAGVDDVCLVMFTSGTTGNPRGVLHSHRTLLAEAASIVELFAMSGSRVFMPSPLSHITGLVYGMVMPLLMGGSVVLMDRWDPKQAVDQIEATRSSTCIGATPFLRGLVDEYRQRGRTSALSSFICGGADVPSHLIQEATEVLAATVARAYGLTEMPTVTCGGPSDSMVTRAGTDGPPVGTSQVRIAAGTSDLILPEGVGELEVRGPELCVGYLNPEDNVNAFTDDGWFRTGDLAHMEGVAVRIVGRIKDIIVRGGENISAREVEDLLVTHPAIDDVALVGVPDRVLGEKACAVVVTTAQRPGLADITAYLGGLGVARYKLPEYVLVAESLPRTVSGKVQKYLVRHMAERAIAEGRAESR